MPCHRGRHRPDQLTSLPMFIEHHAYRAALSAHADFFQRREKQLFFFAMVTLVDKHPEKFQKSVDVVAAGDPAASVDVSADDFQDAQGQANRLVFRRQIFDGVHVKVSSSVSRDGNHRCCRPQEFGL
jgi:hypothetical protein